jgi:hypothetical protein
MWRHRPTKTTMTCGLSPSRGTINGFTAYGLRVPHVQSVLLNVHVEGLARLLA